MKRSKQNMMIVVMAAGILLLSAGALFADVFSTIGFETSEGYAAPQALTGDTLQNIGQGPDFTNYAYGPDGPGGAQMFTWNGVSSTGVNYGVPSGNAAYYFDGRWNNSYTRTAFPSRSMPTERQTNRYFTCEYNSFVNFSASDINNMHIPPMVAFWFNGLDNNQIAIFHSVYGGEPLNGTSESYNLHIRIGGVDTIVGTYNYQAWADEKIVYDRVLGSVDYYYNGALLATLAAPQISSFDDYGLDINFVSRSGSMATDNFRFGSMVPEPGSLLALGMGLTGLFGALTRKRR